MKKTRTNVTINPELLRQAKAKNINISEELEKTLKKTVCLDVKSYEEELKEFLQMCDYCKKSYDLEYMRADLMSLDDKKDFEYAVKNVKYPNGEKLHKDDIPWHIKSLKNGCRESVCDMCYPKVFEYNVGDVFYIRAKKHLSFMIDAYMRKDC